MLSLMVWLLFGIACGVIADSKRRNVGGWVVLGMLFGIFALIVIACLPTLEE